MLGERRRAGGRRLRHEELIDDADFERRGMMQTDRSIPVAGPFKMLGWPVRFGGQHAEIEPAPLLGKHTDEVFGDWLGLDAGRRSSSSAKTNII